MDTNKIHNRLHISELFGLKHYYMVQASAVVEGLTVLVCPCQFYTIFFSKNKIRVDLWEYHNPKIFMIKYLHHLSFYLWAKHNMGYFS